jgi:hypothetical protein
MDLFFAEPDTVINGSISANDVKFGAGVMQNELDPDLGDGIDGVAVPLEEYFIISADISSWLDGTPFEVGEVINAATWNVDRWTQ